MKRNHQMKAVALMATLALTVSACGSSSDDNSANQPNGGTDTYDVGVILPMTGTGAAIGTDFKLAMDVFRKIDPVAKDMDINYILCDDKTTPDGAASCARKLIQQDKVAMIYGPVIGSSHQGASPVLKTGPPSVSSSPYVVIDEGSPIFGGSGTSLDQDTTTLKFAADRGYRKVAVLATTDTTGEDAVTNLREANEDLGLDLSIERMGPTDPDATAQLNKLLEDDPDYIYLAATGAAAGVGLQGLKQLGSEIPTAMIWSNTTLGFLEAAKSSFPEEAVFAVAPSWLPELLDDAERADRIIEFQKAFEKESGEAISFVVQGAYDGFELIAHALDAAGSDPDAILDYLESFDSQTLNWKLTFSPDSHYTEATGNYMMARYDATTEEWSAADSAEG